MNLSRESFEELGQLAALLCDGRLDAEGAARLEQLAGASRQARRFLLDYLHLEGELYWENAVGAAREPPLLHPRVLAQHPTLHLPKWAFLAGMGVCLVFVCLIIWRIMPSASVPASGEATNRQSDPPARRPERSIPKAGSMAAMRALVTSHPRLVHHYPFEGLSPREQRLDRKGSLHLTEAVLHGGRGSGEVDYEVEGWDAESSAIKPHRASVEGNAHGVGLQSETAWGPPATTTVELLLRFDGFPDRRPGTVAGAVATRASRADCGFFFVAVENGILTHLMDGEAEWVESDLKLTPGDWYYVAGTFQVDGEATTINTYAANLTKGEKRLRHVVRNRRAKGVPATGRLGIGKAFDENTAHAYPWPGALDEVAVYEDLLEPTELQRHLDALETGKR